MHHLVAVVVAGFCAGAMNALAGGGSFVSLPALMATGVPSVQANASSTVALFPGGLASAWAYRDGLGPVGSASLRALVVATLIGGVVGAVLLLSTPPTTFDLELPWLLLVATLALGFGPAFSGWLQRHCRVTPAVVVVSQFALGVYGGYFGGAVGIMMMAVWRLLDRRDLKSLNAARTLLVSTANVAAVVIFIVAGAVRWPQTLAMLLAAAAGGYGGAHLGRRLDPRLTRRGTLVLTGGITVVFFVRVYL